MEPDQDTICVHLEDLKIALTFINAIKAASLDNSDLSLDTLQCLCQPIQNQLDINSPYYSSLSPQRSYFNSWYYQTQSLQAEWCWFDRFWYVYQHMHCLTGLFAKLEHCSKCNEDCYDPLVLVSSCGKRKVPQQKFYTIPLGPQIQALWQTPQASINMRYQQQWTEEILAEI